MATKKCANCGMELSEEVNFCPKCGAAVDNPFAWQSLLILRLYQERLSNFIDL